MIRMGLTKRGDRWHLVAHPKEHKSVALCGVDVEFLISNFETGKPVPFADHWTSNICKHCLRNSNIE